MQTTLVGKLTSLNPNFANISLSKTLSVFSVSETGIFESFFASEYECQIHQDQGDFFISYTGSGLSVHIEDQICKENDPFKVNSGEKIVLSLNGFKIEYILSAEVLPTEKNVLKREREADEEGTMLEKQRKFLENLESESKCGVCKKTIYECASVIPCLHRFCIECLLLHLAGSQTCPLCGCRCLNFRKDNSLNKMIEAFKESGYQNDRSEEEWREIQERLERERIYARFEYQDGGFYEGEWKKFTKDGKGKMRTYNGEFYEGDMKDGLPGGRGKYIYSTGASYEGDWKNGQPEGTGKVIYGNGDVYVGDFKNAKKEGKGIMRATNGDVYEGDWKGNVPGGRGKYLYRNGSVYEGEWKYGSISGKGKMIYNNGDVYEGDWINDLQHGKGKMMYKNGYIYEGEWKFGELDGKGTMTYANNKKNNSSEKGGFTMLLFSSDGSILEGDWNDGVFREKGKIRCDDGYLYEGDFKRDQRHGEGKMIYKNGDVYEGQWKNNKREGKGKMTSQNGDVYEGYWKGDEKQGEGKVITNDQDDDDDEGNFRIKDEWTFY